MAHLRNLCIGALLGIGMVASTALILCGELLELIDGDDERGAR